MKSKIKYLLTLLTATLCMLSALCCNAAPLGSITVLLQDQDKQDVEGLTVQICQIARLGETGYLPAPPFENAGLSISGVAERPDAQTALTLRDYVTKQNIDTLSATSTEGAVTFENLEEGIWLVFAEGQSHVFNPFLVFLPYQISGGLAYHVTSAPKLAKDTADTQQIHVLKRWEDGNTAHRPESITVELMEGDRVVTTARLSEQSGWTHTFADLPAGDYTVREQAVPNYTAHYSGDATGGFIITNTYAGDKLPQTGQYWWPVILLAVAGAGFILLGIYESRTGKYEKK